MKNRFIYAALAATALVGAPAMAADLAVGTPPYYRPPSPPPPLMFTWTGCHLGGHIGGGFTNNDFTNLVGDTAVATSFGVPVIVETTANSVNFGSNGFLVGGQAGCDFQLPWRWVIGFEGDAAWANITGSKLLTASTTVIAPDLTTTTTVNSTSSLSLKTDFIATATARLGYAVGFLGQGLIYAKGGAAWVGNKDGFDGQVSTKTCEVLTPTVCSSAVTPFDFSASQTRLGWTVGVGVEWAVLRYWSVKGEYDFMDFGDHTVTLTDPVLGGAASVNVKQQISEVKFGINYRFGPGLVPAY
jgi:outer membrane immunogenic protein